MKPRQKYRKTSLENTEKKRKRLIIIFGTIMITTMVVSIIGFTDFSGTAGSQMRYGDYEFELQQRANGGTVLVSAVNGIQVEFQNLPLQVTHLQVEPEAVSLMRNAQQVILSADPLETPQDAALIDYARLQLERAFGKTVSAISTPNETYTLPIFNCTMASPQFPVVMFNLSNGTGTVVVEGSCIWFNGRDQELMRIKDRMIFEYLGILEQGAVV